mgnify:CR=1 FL=1
MSIKRQVIVAATAILLAGCQQNSYRIQGIIEGAADGDTLFLTTDIAEGTPRDTIIVVNGRFELEGATDSTYFCMVYSKANPTLSASFFIEPGTIEVHIAAQQENTVVGGTGVNKAWQQLNDSSMSVGREMNRIAERMYTTNPSFEEQQKAVEQIQQLNSRFSSIVIGFAERNISNELGYFIITSFPDEVIASGERLRLIELMPKEMRQRKAISEMEQTLRQSALTSEGAKLQDFTMTALAGNDVNIMSEIAAHKITIIDFWASWCAPCRAEMPLMVSMYREFSSKGLGIVGISLDNDKEAWKSAVDELNMSWPQLSDLKGWENEAAKRFNITSIPHTVVVDQQGTILRRGLRGEELKAYIAEQLK